LPRPPRPNCGSLQPSPDPLAAFIEDFFYGKGMEGERREGRVQQQILAGGPEFTVTPLNNGIRVYYNIKH